VVVGVVVVVAVVVAVVVVVAGAVVVAAVVVAEVVVVGVGVDAAPMRTMPVPGCSVTEVTAAPDGVE
jgi:hypothetical protein